MPVTLAIALLTASTTHAHDPLIDPSCSARLVREVVSDLADQGKIADAVRLRDSFFGRELSEGLGNTSDGYVKRWTDAAGALDLWASPRLPPSSTAEYRFARVLNPIGINRAAQLEPVWIRTIDGREIAGRVTHISDAKALVLTQERNVKIEHYVPIRESEIAIIIRGTKPSADEERLIRVQSPDLIPYPLKDGRTLRVGRITKRSADGRLTACTTHDCTSTVEFSYSDLDLTPRVMRAPTMGGRPDPRWPITRERWIGVTSPGRLRGVVQVVGYAPDGEPLVEILEQPGVIERLHDRYPGAKPFRLRLNAAEHKADVRMHSALKSIFETIPLDPIARGEVVELRALLGELMEAPSSDWLLAVTAGRHLRRANWQPSETQKILNSLQPLFVRSRASSPERGALALIEDTARLKLPVGDENSLRALFGPRHRVTLHMTDGTTYTGVIDAGDRTSVTIETVTGRYQVPLALINESETEYLGIAGQN